MTIAIGNRKLGKIYVGNTPTAKAYQGSVCVYSAEDKPPFELNMNVITAVNSSNTVLDTNTGAIDFTLVSGKSTYITTATLMDQGLDLLFDVDEFILNSKRVILCGPLTDSASNCQVLLMGDSKRFWAAGKSGYYTAGNIKTSGNIARVKVYRDVSSNCFKETVYFNDSLLIDYVTSHTWDTYPNWVICGWAESTPSSYVTGLTGKCIGNKSYINGQKVAVSVK